MFGLSSLDCRTSVWSHVKPDPLRDSPRRGRLWDLRRWTMTPIMSAAPMRTTASTEKLVMAASFHTSGGSSTDLPGGSGNTVGVKPAEPRANAGGKRVGVCESLTCVAGGRLGVQLARWTRHANIQVGVPELWVAALTCAREKNILIHKHDETSSNTQGPWDICVYLASARSGRKRACSQKLTSFLGFFNNDASPNAAEMGKVYCLSRLHFSDSVS